MTFTTGARLARIAPRLRLIVLVAFALLVAHDAIFVAEFGIGDRFAEAMAQGGHDGYWLPYTLLIGVAAIGVFVASIAVLSGTRRQAIELADTPGPSYLAELVATWRWLLPIVVFAFALQAVNASSSPPAPSASAAEILVPLGLPVGWVILAIGFLWRRRSHPRSVERNRSEP
jgi:hypothetical protein